MKARHIKRRLSAFPRPMVSFYVYGVAASFRGKHSGRWAGPWITDGAHRWRGRRVLVCVYSVPRAAMALLWD